MYLEPLREVWLRIPPNTTQAAIQKREATERKSRKVQELAAQLADQFQHALPIEFYVEEAKRILEVETTTSLPANVIPEGSFRVPNELLYGDISIEETAGYVTEIRMSIRSLALLDYGNPNSPAVFPLMNPGLLQQYGLRASVKCGYWRDPITGLGPPVVRWYMIDGFLTALDPGIGNDGLPVVSLTFQNYGYAMARTVRNVQYPTAPELRGDAETIPKKFKREDFDKITTPEWAFATQLSSYEILSNTFSTYGYQMSVSSPDLLEKLKSRIWTVGERKAFEQNGMTDWSMILKMGKEMSFAAHLDVDTTKPETVTRFVLENMNVSGGREGSEIFKKNRIAFFNNLLNDVYISNPIIRFGFVQREVTTPSKIDLNPSIKLPLSLSVNRAPSFSSFGADQLDLSKRLGDKSSKTTISQEDYLGFAMIQEPDLNVPNAGYTQRYMDVWDIQSGERTQVGTVEDVTTEYLKLLEIDESQIWDIKTDKAGVTTKELTPEAKKFMEQFGTDLASARWSDVYNFFKRGSVKVTEKGNNPFQRFIWKGWTLGFVTFGNPWCYIGFSYPVMGLSPYYNGRWYLRSMSHTVGNAWTTKYEFYK